MRRLLPAVLALALAGCASPDPEAAAPTGAGGTEPHRYRATATVLSNREHGPELCLGAVLDSLPPQCGGVPLTNWRWDQVGGARTVNGVTWGTYSVVGDYDGASFTVAEAEPVPPGQGGPREQPAEPASPCPVPPGGWPVPDPARRSERFLEPVNRAARAQPDFAGLWLSYLTRMGPNVAAQPGEFVLNVAFTGDLARHEAQLRPRWGGRLCVTRQQRSHEELLRIQRELQGPAAADLGLEVLSTGIAESVNAVDLHVVVLPSGVREAIQARWGAGSVRVTAALTPA